MSERLKRFLAMKEAREDTIEPFIPQPVEMVEWAPRKRLQVQSKWIYGYIRVSTFDQFKSGLGLEAQLHQVEVFIQRIRELRPQWKDHKFAGVYIDGPQSAVKKDLKERQVGGVLCERLRPGDGVIFLRYDRAFRNFRHMLNQKHEWDKNGIHMIFMDLDLDLTTPHGEAMLHLYGLIAQVEAKNTSERTKAALSAKKRRGDKLGRFPKVGMVIVRRWDERDERRTSKEYIRHDLMPILRLIAFYRETMKMTFPQISDRIETLQARREGNRKPKPRYRVRDGRTWDARRCTVAYKTWTTIVEDRRRLNWWEHAIHPETVGMVRGHPYITVRAAKDQGLPTEVGVKTTSQATDQPGS